MEKNELIKQLYESGKITFDEALALASKEDGPEGLGKQTVDTRVKEKQLSLGDKKKLLIDELVNGIVSENIDEVTGEHYEFDVEKVVKFMNNNNWQWRDETVTNDMFKETLSKLLRETLEKTVCDYLSGRWIEQRDGEEYPGHHTTECGGIKVESWINDEFKVIEANAKFIDEESLASADLSVLD